MSSGSSPARPPRPPDRRRADRRARPARTASLSHGHTAIVFPTCSGDRLGAGLDGFRGSAARQMDQLTSAHRFSGPFHTRLGAGKDAKKFGPVILAGPNGDLEGTVPRRHVANRAILVTPSLRPLVGFQAGFAGQDPTDQVVVIEERDLFPRGRKFIRIYDSADVAKDLFRLVERCALSISGPFRRPDVVVCAGGEVFQEIGVRRLSGFPMSSIIFLL